MVESACCCATETLDCRVANEGAKRKRHGSEYGTEETESFSGCVGMCYLGDERCFGIYFLFSAVS